jgi:hypothetical protein
MKKSSYTPADLNDGFVVSVMIEAKEGEGDAVAGLIAQLVAPTLAEPGAIRGGLAGLRDFLSRSIGRFWRSASAFSV